MTREEAIAIIENEKECVNRANKNDYCNRDCYNCELVKTDTEILTALDMAIEALEQEPCDDATLKDIFCMGCEYREQEPKTGHWFVDERPESDREIICSNCEQPIFKYHKMDFDYRPKYCPNCGAKMESEEKE